VSKTGKDETMQTTKTARELERGDVIVDFYGNHSTVLSAEFRPYHGVTVKVQDHNGNEYLFKANADHDEFTVTDEF
jgi:hypothetical protein